MQQRQSSSYGVAVAERPAKVATRVGRSSRARRPVKPMRSNRPFCGALASLEGGVFNPMNIEKLVGEAR